ncbi:sulfatase/phosphatase domain-containing protein [Candidatus Poribacteria bacterium]
MHFCSDNGHEVYYLQEGRTSGRRKGLNGENFDNINSKFYSETGGDVFNGNDEMGGLKFSSWEGGTRIPYLIRWPGAIEPKSTSDHMCANYDLMPTLADIVGLQMPEDKDGISFLPTMLGKEKNQDKHDFVVYASGVGPALVTGDGWKIRYINRDDDFQLYDPKKDYREDNDLAADCPEIVDRLSKWLLEACDGDYEHGTPQNHNVTYDP